jgi:hypothetical protein
MPKQEIYLHQIKCIDCDKKVKYYKDFPQQKKSTAFTCDEFYRWLHAIINWRITHPEELIRRRGM